MMSNGSFDVSKKSKKREIGRDDEPKTGCVRTLIEDIYSLFWDTIV